MVVEKLEPIKISVVAPRKCCKTTLIVLFYKYLLDCYAKQSGVCEINCTKNKSKLDEFSAGLSNMPDNPSENDMVRIIPPTMQTDPVEYEFCMTLKTEELCVMQQIQFFDIAGEFLDRFHGGYGKYENKPWFLNFEEHLHKSNILWIPIDVTAYMEDISPKMSQSYKSLSISNIKAAITEWNSYCGEKGGVLHFIPVKCEQYFLRYEDAETCFSKFCQCYDEILKADLKNTKMLYTPVKIGFGTYWDSHRKWMSCKQSDLQGVNDLFDSVLNCTSENLRNFLIKNLNNSFGFNIPLFDGKSKFKDLAVKIVEYFTELIRIKTENINDNFNFNKALNTK